MKNLTTGADSPLIGAAEIQSPMNWQTALERLDGNDDLLKELAVVFCDECPKLILTLQKATDNKDANAIRSAAHALKGVLGTFSADVASQTAAKLENLAEAGSVTELATVSAELIAEVGAVFIALRVMTTDPPEANGRSATENVQRDLTYDWKVLIADDDPISRRLLEVSLTAEGYQPAIAVDGSEALRLLEEPNSPKLAVVNWMMPYVDGLKVCKTIRQRATDAYVYIILLTARGRKEEIIAGLEAGADDYLTKPFDVLELKARLRTGRRMLGLQGQLVAAREHLRVLATHDSLTGIWNRAAILDQLETELSRSKRSGVPLAVIMADLDRFKHINDTRGHLVGDIVLRAAAIRMKNALRAYDSIGRYGGEEFLVVAPGCDYREAGNLAERLRVAICNENIEVQGTSLAFTVSIGVSVTEPASTSETLLCTADEALYEAKRKGRNMVTIGHQVA
jgi:two-component system cell cycle response regulator